MFQDKKRDWHVPHFNGSPGVNFEVWSTRLTAAHKAKVLGAQIESPGAREHAASFEERLAKQKQTRLVIGRALRDNTLRAGIDCSSPFELYVKLN